MPCQNGDFSPFCAPLDREDSKFAIEPGLSSHMVGLVNVEATDSVVTVVIL